MHLYQMLHKQEQNNENVREKLQKCFYILGFLKSLNDVFKHNSLYKVKNRWKQNYTKAMYNIIW